MLDQNDRIAQFINVISQDEQERRVKAEKEIVNECKRQLDKYTKTVKSKSHSEIARRKEKLLSQTGSVLNTAVVDSRKRLSEKRSNITDKVFSMAADKLSDFTKTDEYINLLKKSASEMSHIFTDGNVTLLVKEDDLKNSDAIKEAFGRDCELASDSSIKLGGCKAHCDSVSFIADDTLDSRLLSQREYFLTECGLSIVKEAAQE